MADYTALKLELQQSLIKSIRKKCCKYMQTDENVLGVEGLFGVTISNEHTFLFNIKESRHNGETETTSPVSVQESEASPTPPRPASVENRKTPVENAVQLTGTLEYTTLSREELRSMDVGTSQPLRQSPSHPIKSESCTERKSSQTQEKRQMTHKHDQVKSDAESPVKRRKIQSAQAPSTPNRVELQAPSDRKESEPSPVNKPAEPDVSLTASNDKPESLTYQNVLSVNENGVIFCTICWQVFSSKRNGWRHVKFKHFKEGYSCPTCQKLFRTNMELGDHIIGEHSGDSTPYTCDECNKGFKSRHTLREHCISTHMGGRFRCHLCDEGFSSSKKCREHLTTKHPHCEECGMSVVTLDGHVCSGPMESFMNLPTDSSGAGPGSFMGPAGVNRIRLNKKALGELAKSVAEHVVSGNQEEQLISVQNKESDGECDQRKRFNEENNQHESDDSDYGEIRQRYAKPTLSTSYQSLTGNRSPKHLNEEDERMQTPSPSPSDLSDCAVMYICETCDADFNTQEEYHAHIIQHPWCSRCGERVPNLLRHRPHCHSSRDSTMPPLAPRAQWSTGREETHGNITYISIDD